MTNKSRSFLYYIFMAIYITTVIATQTRHVHAMSRSTSSSSRSPSSFLSRLTTKSHVASTLGGRLSPSPSPSHHPSYYYSPSSLRTMDDEEEEEGQPDIDANDFIQTCKEYIGKIRTSLQQRPRRRRSNDNDGFGASYDLSKILAGDDNAPTSRAKYHVKRESARPASSSYVTTAILRMRRHRASPARTRNIKMRYLCLKYALGSLLRSDSYGDDADSSSHQLLNTIGYHNHNQYQIPFDFSKAFDNWNALHLSPSSASASSSFSSSPSVPSDVERGFPYSSNSKQGFSGSEYYGDDLNTVSDWNDEPNRQRQRQQQQQQQQHQDTAASKTLLLGKREKGEDDGVKGGEEKEGKSSPAFHFQEGEREEKGDTGNGAVAEMGDNTLLNGSRGGARSKRFHRLSINQALMVLTDMVVDSQRQRSIRNENRMRHHLQSLG